MDDSEEFTYTVSGGRDLSSNKRTAEQTSDETLTKVNVAIAKNCHAEFDAENGAEAEDWKEIRVVKWCGVGLTYRTPSWRSTSRYGPLSSSSSGARRSRQTVLGVNKFLLVQCLQVFGRSKI